ncbi:hypothetical protein C8Q79DRAFT_945262 [Trametes meyenii]|nr:hypothetical protein C8Q79DRAFT_945262 [Trametes meyenii]
MENIPVEILHPIFLQACTDGGRTGRSLALTSRYIHAASRAVRFHTVALVSGSPAQVVQFLDCFTSARAVAQAVGEDATPAVHHFSLVAAKNSLPEELRVAGPGSASGESQKEVPRTLAKAVYGVSGVFTQDEHRYFEAIVTLVRLIAPDLRRLCLIDDEDARRPDAALHIPMLQSAGFPRLVELVIVGREPAGRRMSDACTPFYPHLRTYQRDLQPEFCPWGFKPPREPKLEQWREVAPRLIDLHVFEIGYQRNTPNLCWALLEHPATHLSSELRELVACSPPVPPPPPEVPSREIKWPIWLGRRQASYSQGNGDSGET